MVFGSVEWRKADEFGSPEKGRLLHCADRRRGARHVFPIAETKGKTPRRTTGRGVDHTWVGGMIMQSVAQMSYWTAWAAIVAELAHEKHFSSRRGHFRLTEPDALCLFDNNP